MGTRTELVNVTLHFRPALTLIKLASRQGARRQGRGGAEPAQQEDEDAHLLLRRPGHPA